MRFDERTHKFEYKLNDTDDQIIDYIKERHAEFVTQSIQTVAANVFTVPNTITRLSKKLGYDGFSHMKSSLKEELESPGETPEDDSHSLIQKTFEILDKERMEEAARLLVDSKQIQLFGVGIPRICVRWWPAIFAWSANPPIIMCTGTRFCTVWIK
ncbi:MurR/RpiR family transcriptional regulator [Rossellomorea sp. H39__3]